MLPYLRVVPPWQLTRLVKNLMLRNVVMLIWRYKKDLIVKNVFYQYFYIHDVMLPWLRVLPPWQPTRLVKNFMLRNVVMLI